MAGLHTIAFATHDALAFSGWPMCCALGLLRLLFQFGRILIQTADLSGAAGPFMDAKNACCRGSIVTGMGCVFVPLGCASRPPRLSSPVRRFPDFDSFILHRTLPDAAHKKAICRRCVLGIPTRLYERGGWSRR